MRRRRTCRSEIFVGREQFQCGRLEGHHRQWPHEHCTPWYTISWPVKGGDRMGTKGKPTRKTPRSRKPRRRERQAARRAKAPPVGHQVASQRGAERMSLPGGVGSEES